MFCRKQVVIEQNDESIVWVLQKGNEKRSINQWMRQDFIEIWMTSIEEAFDLLGMNDRMSIWEEETDHKRVQKGPIETLVPVMGWRNRRSLSTAMRNIQGVSNGLEIVPIKRGTMIRLIGDEKQAINDWGVITNLLSKTMVISLVTPGLRYFVEGSQVGYDPETRHLFTPQNKLERIGSPVEPIWRATISGHIVNITANWDEIIRVRNETGLNIFQMFQLRLNGELKKAIKIGS